MSKRLLAVTYYFPPLGGVGVQRISKFCKYLPRFGWSPVVVAPEPSAFYMKDEGMLADVKHVEIHRVKTPDSFRMHRKATGRDKPKIDSPLRKIARVLTWPDTHRGFAKKTLPLVRELSTDVKAIFVTAPPWSNLLLVPRLKKETNLPIIADMRDPWYNHPIHYRILWKRWLSMRAERRLLESADVVICATKLHAGILAEQYPDFENRIQYLPNGFDPEDFSGKVRKSKMEPLRICYTGILGLERINEGTTLYEALRILRDEDGLRQSDLRFEIIGEVSRKEDARARMKGVEEFIERPGFLPHRETMRRLETADLAFLPYHARYSWFIVPAKTYEYIGSGTPILAEVNARHEVAALVKETRTGLTVDEGDVDGMVDALRLLLAGRFPYRPERKQIPIYDRRNQARELTRILDELTKNE